MTDSNFNLPRFNLGDRYAVISGAAGLLGIEHARAILAANGNVILWDIESNSLDRATTQLKSEFDPIRIRSGIVDVTDEMAINKAVEILIKENIEISILINNAAINPKYSSAQLDHSRLENFTLENWNKEISVGLTSAFLCSKIVGSRMANHNNNGVILNIASDLSLIAPDQRLYRVPNRAADNQPVKPVTYSVIKSGIIGLTKYLSTYWNEQGVRVNSLSPGGIYENQPEEFVSRVSSLIPLGRMANRDEYRSAVQFLCSDASSYMTGQNLVIDGGRTVW
jgi:NAD(P)-dependent dehydrogenase (short-subunit alcohol dehydrogenase family)